MMMTKLIYLAIGLLLLAFPQRARALHMPHRLFEMVGGADIIVLGEIESLTGTTYVLKIERVIVGKHGSKTIEVRRHQDWVCDWRYGAYEVGQKLLAFLKHDEHLSLKMNRPIYSIMSGSGGEIPVVDDAAYLSFASAGIPTVSLGRHSTLTRFPLNDVISAIQGHRLLYRVTLGNEWDESGYFTTKLERIRRGSPRTESPFRSRQAPAQVLTLETYSRMSVLHRFLADSTEAAARHLGLASIGWKFPLNDTQTQPTVVRYRAAIEASKETEGNP